MALDLECNFNQVFSVPIPIEKAFAYFLDFPKSVGDNFPGLVDFQPKGDDSYRWEFQGFSAGNKEIKIEFVTRFVAELNRRILIQPVPNQGNSKLMGAWSFEPEGNTTIITLDIKMQSHLPLPFLLKPVANALIQSKIKQYFESYTENIVKSIA